MTVTVREFIQNLLLSCPKQEDLDRDVYIQTPNKWLYDTMEFDVIDGSNAFLIKCDMNKDNYAEEN